MTTEKIHALEHDTLEQLGNDTSHSPPMIIINLLQGDLHEHVSISDSYLSITFNVASGQTVKGTIQGTAAEV